MRCVGCPDSSVLLFPVMFNMDFSYSLQFDLSTLDNFLLRSAVEILFGSFIIKLLQLSTIFSLGFGVACSFPGLHRWFLAPLIQYVVCGRGRVRWSRSLLVLRQAFSFALSLCSYLVFSVLSLSALRWRSYCVTLF